MLNEAPLFRTALANPTAIPPPESVAQLVRGGRAEPARRVLVPATLAILGRVPTSKLFLYRALGATALKIINEQDPDFVLCMGDDTTDEDMFKALEGEAYTIKVNSGASAAQYNILSQQRVIPLLNSLIQPPAPSGAEMAVQQQVHGGS